MGPQRQNNIVLDLQILRIRQIFNLEKALYFRHTLCSQIHDFILFIDNEIACFLALHAHDGIHLRQLFHILAAGQLSGQNIAGLIQLRRLAALTGNDQRGAGLVDQHGVYLVDDRVMQIPKHQLLFVDDHVVTQIIKPQLVIRHIGNITVIGLPALVRFHVI